MRNWRSVGRMGLGWLSWVLLLVIQPATLFGQTPWQSSPAQPANVPADKTLVEAPAGTTAQSLPPPPKNPTPLQRAPGEGSAPAGTLSASALVELEKRLSELGQGRPSPGRIPLPQIPAPPSASPIARAMPSGTFDIPLPDPSKLAQLPLPTGNTPAPPASRSGGQPFQLPSAQQGPGIVGGGMTGNLVTNKSLVGPMEAAGGPPESGAMFEPGKLIAVVGSEHVLAGDLAHYVEPVIEQNRDRIPKAQEPLIREQILRQALKSHIVTKAMHQEFFRDAAGAATPDKVEESKQMVTTRAREIFFDKQVPELLQRYEVSTMGDLEVKLRERAMALSTMQKQFVEQVLASELERKYIPREFEFSRQELLDYYQAHREQWQRPARARWQQLTIRFDKHDYDRAEVDQRIKALGDEIYLGGKSFEVVAQQSSEGYRAAQGGLQEWTALGALKSKPIESTVFSIEMNRLSKVITDEVGMHIVRVLGREEAHQQSFADVQIEIRKTLSKERRQKELAEFRKTVVDRTPIWTQWPEDIDGKRVFPLSQALGEQ